MYNSGYISARLLCVLVNDNIKGITLFIKGYIFRMENPGQLLKLQRNAWKASDLEKTQATAFAKTQEKSTLEVTETRIVARIHGRPPWTTTS